MSVSNEHRPDNNGDSEWYQVSKGYPCPVCGKPDWCCATGPEGDPAAVVCMRKESDNLRGNGGWLHRLRPATSSSPRSNGTAYRAATDRTPAPTPSPRIEKRSQAPGSFEKRLLIEECTKEHKHSAFWVYHDTEGNEVGAAVRYDDKDGGKRVLPWSVNDRRRWVNKAISDPRPLYDLHILSKLAEGSRVFVVEGEKCAESLKALGLTATTSSNGSKAAGKSDWSPLAGMDVIVLPDNDEPGAVYREDVLDLLHQLEPRPSIRVVDLPGLPDKGDVADWLAAGGTAEQLLALVSETATWTPKSEPWPELQPFEEERLPEFPVEVLPSPLREWVQAESIATQTPPDLAGLLALAVCSSAIARRIVVEPRPKWVEPTNTYVAVVLEPANRKSAVFADATAPMREVERSEVDAAREEVAQEQSERRQAVKRLEKLERELAKNYSAAKADEARELVHKLANWSERALPRRIVDDATHEKLGIMLAEQGGRIASMSPEGGVFDLMAGQYSNSGMVTFGVYLMGHSGDDLRTDRVSRKGVYVERPALTIAYAIQRAVIEGLADKPSFRGKGLLARFLYAAPKSWIGSRDIAPPWVPEETTAAYHELVRQLCGCELEGSLALDNLADAVFQRWHQQVEDMLGKGGTLDMIQDWGGKLVGETLRLAGIMHCVRHAGGNPLQHEMDAETMGAAVQIAEYLIPHAELVLTQMSSGNDYGGDEIAELAQILLKWVARKKNSTFKKRDAHQDISRFKNQQVEALDPVLAELEKRGYIREQPAKKSGRGRPPSPQYEVNPEFFVLERPEKRPQKPQKSGAGIAGENIEVFETPTACSDNTSSDLKEAPDQSSGRTKFEI